MTDSNARLIEHAETKGFNSKVFVSRHDKRLESQRVRRAAGRALSALKSLELVLGDDYDVPGSIPRKMRIEAALYVQAGLDRALRSGLAKQYQGPQKSDKPRICDE
jgi:hypothetical protein